MTKETLDGIVIGLNIAKIIVLGVALGYLIKDDKGKGVYKVAKEYEEAGIENVVVYLFEGMRHEILNEKNKQHVYDVVLRWLNKNE